VDKHAARIGYRLAKGIISLVSGNAASIAATAASSSVVVVVVVVVVEFDGYRNRRAARHGRVRRRGSRGRGLRFAVVERVFKSTLATPLPAAFLRALFASFRR
jgi:hypothetical protein